MTPEQKARQTIDALLQQAGWHVCSMDEANIHAARGVALREFPLNAGYGFADYLLYIDGKAAGVIEAKKEGSTLTGVEVQSARYAQGLPGMLPAWRRPLPFSYESTGIETHFTQGLDPQPRARAVFAFHRPETLAAFLKDATVRAAPVAGHSAREPRPAYLTPAANDPATFLARLQSLPPLIEDGLWPAQKIAIRNLEASLKANKPRALIQMATGSGKIFTGISFIYRLIKFAGARRVLFLVDRGNLGRQTKKEFDQYTSPYNNFKFGEEYIVQHLTSNTLDTTARVAICTIQRLFSMLKGRELAEEDDEVSFLPLPLGEGRGEGGLFARPEPVAYNPSFPIETFDIIVTDEAHRSIYNLWRQVLEYFDAYLIGLTATPSKQTFGFFNQNLVMEYGHQQAVADGVNVNYDVYRIRTQVSEHGSQVEAGYSVGYRDRLTRNALDPDFPPPPLGEGWGGGAPPSALQTATQPLCHPALRNLLIDLKKKAEQIIDTVTQDSLLEADFSEAARDRAKGNVESFERFIAEHKDEIIALQILYHRPQRLQWLAAETLTFEALKALADALQAPPHPHRPGQPGALCHAPGQRTGAPL